jgi:hypothetical protein
VTRGFNSCVTANSFRHPASAQIIEAFAWQQARGASVGEGGPYQHVGATRAGYKK